jgi:hypothetical protein
MHDKLDLDALLRAHGGLEGLPRELGQSDPTWMYAGSANDNEQQSKRRNMYDPRRSTPRHTMGLGVLRQA